MRKKPRLLILLSTFLLLIALGMAAWLLHEDPTVQRQQLPDGTILKLEGVTYGRQHELKVGAPWQKLLGPLLPARFQPPVVSGPTFSEDRIVCWFSESPTVEERAKRPGFGSIVHYLSERSEWPDLLDEYGSRIDRTYVHSVRGLEAGLHTAALSTFPRRGRSIRLLYHDARGQTPVAEFVVPNPDPGPHPEWIGEPLPTTRAAGDLRCTLTGLRSSVTNRHYSSLGLLPMHAETVASLHVTRKGRPTWDWEPTELTVVDATGNRLPTRRSRSEWSLRGLTLRWPGALPSGEAAWKLRVGFFPTPRAPSTPGETWTLHDVPIPKKDAATVLQKTAVVRGLKLTVLGLGGVGPQRMPGDPRPPWGDWASPEVRVTATQRRKDQRVTLLVTDERGRTFAGYGSHGWENPGQQQFSYYLNLPLDSRKLDMRFTVSTGRTVEFLVRPTDASASATPETGNVTPGP